MLCVSSISSGKQETKRAREGMAILLGDVWHECGCVSSIIL